jgi:hypothetical protein
VATFNYIKAIWKNGTGVVSDAPDWVQRAIERALPAWMSGHERDLVGVHLDRESALGLGIFVSPSALGSESLLEDAGHGSFVHVLASDHPDRSSLSLDEVRELFESVYGAPLSDAAVRQQRNFMLLDFPYHRELAVDLFVGKDRVEEGATRQLSPRPSGAGSGPVGAGSSEGSDSPNEDDPQLLSSLLHHRRPEASPKTSDGLPFDQGLSYQEVLTRLADAALRQARNPERPDFPNDSAPDASPVAAPSTLDASLAEGVSSPEAAVEVDDAGAAGEYDSLPLSSLVSYRAVRADAKYDLPFDQGLTYEEVLERLANAVQPMAQVEREETGFQFAIFERAPVLVRSAAVVGVILLLLGGVIASRLWLIPANESPAEFVTLAPLPSESAPVAPQERELADRDHTNEVDVHQGVATEVVLKGAPEVVLRAAPEVVEVDPPALATIEVEVAPEVVVREPSIEAAALVQPPVAVEQELAAVQPDAGVPAEAGTRLVADARQVGDTQQLAAAPQVADARRVAADEVEAARQEEGPSVVVESVPDFEAVVDPAPPSVSSGMESVELGSAVAEPAVERQSEQKGERRRRERKRVMRQIQGYR